VQHNTAQQETQDTAKMLILLGSDTSVCILVILKYGI
jgi:hypothetical protein